MLTLIRKPVALATLITATIIGIASMTLFMVFLYAGPFNWVILDINEAGRLVFNTALSSVFFLQHSGMVRKPFRRRLERIIPPHYQGGLYTIASGLIVIAIFALWQSSNLIIEVSGLPRGVMRACFFLSILGTFWGFWALHPIDFSYMLGLKPILNNLRVKPSFPMPLRIRGPYRWVRHPLYLFIIVIIWAYPLLTADRLLFNVLWTIWIVIGAFLEERDLVANFGAAYRDYQQRVPMFIPRRLRPVSSN